MHSASNEDEDVEAIEHKKRLLQCSQLSCFKKTPVFYNFNAWILKKLTSQSIDTSF